MLNLKYLRYSAALAACTAVPRFSQAQEVRPLQADPARAVYAPTKSSGAARGQALALPFFDDFTSPREGAPKSQNWLPSGGTLVSNRFAVEPPTRGAVSLDGLRANGQPYGSGGSSATDTLTSQPIDLGGRTAADRVFVGFYWQSGNVARAPQANSSTRTVSLTLEFRDNAGNWQSVWVRRSDGTRTPFRRRFVAVDQARFLHGNFQFRFRAVGDVAENRDTWALDYVKVLPVRQTADTVYQDVATSQPLSSLLARGTAMPVWQYNAASNPASQLNPAVFTTINNLNTSGFPVPAPWRGTVQVQPAGPVPFALTTPGQSLSSPASQFRVEGDLRTAAVPTTPDPKLVRHQIDLNTNETNPLTLPNDTIFRVTELNDYYAYDDGTAEANISIPQFEQPAQPRFYALRFTANRPDQVRSIRIVPSYPVAASRRITVNIWDEDPNSPGQPARTAKASQSVTFDPTPRPGRTFVEVSFAQPVPVSGTFFAGYGHGPTGLAANPSIPIGLDLNNPVPADAFWQFFLDVWNQPVGAFYPRGALMVRPVLNNNVLSTAPAAVAAAYALYPNPTADGRVQVQGRYARAAVLDALGRTVWEQPAAEHGQPALALPGTLPPGVYVVQLTLPNAQVVTKRLVLTR